MLCFYLDYKIGEVPKYLQDRKDNEVREKEKQEQEFDPDCPPGHIAMSDEDRRESLDLAKKSIFFCYYYYCVL